CTSTTSPAPCAAPRCDCAPTPAPTVRTGRSDPRTAWSAGRTGPSTSASARTPTARATGRTGRTP
ncbi:MAG: hypothetical protein AVDCRST_MAG32-1620, partial [uncultured Nocardioides sp.]